MLYKHLFRILCGHLNLNQKRKKFEFNRLPVKPAGIPVRTGWTATFEFKFEFNRFLPVTGQTDPVNRNRRPAITANQSDNLTRGAAPGTSRPGIEPGRVGSQPETSTTALRAGVHGEVEVSQSQVCTKCTNKFTASIPAVYKDNFMSIIKSQSLQFYS